MRLIDADFLLWKLNHDCVPFNADVNAAIRNAATVDAVGVIRCKDCKYFYPAGVIEDFPACNAWDDRSVVVISHTSPEGYCYRAKRRKKE